MPATEQQKKAYLASKGYSTDDYTLEEVAGGYTVKPIVKAQPTALSDTYGTTQQAQQANAYNAPQAKPDESMSGTRAFGTMAGRGVLPALAGLGVGALAAPFTGGLSLWPSLLTLGTLGAGAAYTTSKLQEPLLEGGMLSIENAQKAQAQQPYAALAGSIAPNLIAMKPSLSLPYQGAQSLMRSAGGKVLTDLEKANLGNMAVGAALPAATTAYMGVAETGQLPPIKDILREAAIGAAFSNPNRLGQKVFGFHQMPDRVLPQDVRADGAQLMRPDALGDRQASPLSAPIETSLDNIIQNQQQKVQQGKFPLNDKGIKKAERAQEGISATWRTTEPDDYSVQQMEGEGGPTPKVTKEQEELAAIQQSRQVAENNAILNKERALEANARREAKLAEVEKAKIELDLQDLEQSMKAGQMNPATVKGVNPQRDFTRDQAKINEQVKLESPEDLALRKAEGLTGDKYQQEGQEKVNTPIPDNTPYETFDTQTGEVVHTGLYKNRSRIRQAAEVRNQNWGAYRYGTRVKRDTKLQETPQGKVLLEAAPEKAAGIPRRFVEAMKRLGLTRNVQVDTTTGKLYPKEGSEINGKAWMENGLRRVLANVGPDKPADTLPHEITHHWFDDLAKSPRKSDVALRAKLLAKVEAHPDYLAYKARNPEVTAEEFLVQATGEKTIVDISNSDASLWKDLVSSVKARYSSKPKVEDLARFLSSRVLTDAPYSEVYTKSANIRTGMVEKNQEDENKIIKFPYSRKKEFNPFEEVLKVEQETDPSMVKDNFNNYQEGLEQAKLNGTLDDVETEGMLRDAALSRYRQIFKKEPDWGVSSPGKPDLNKLSKQKLGIVDREGNVKYQPAKDNYSPEDAKRYREIWDTIIAKQADDAEFPFTTEGQKLWKESETIKNKYKGFAPGDKDKAKMQPEGQEEVLNTGEKNQPATNLERIFTPVLENVERKGPEGKKVANALKETMSVSRAKAAEMMKPIGDELSRLNSKQSEELWNILYDEDSSHASARASVPTELKGAYDAIRKSFEDSATEQVAAGQPVFDYNTGKYRARGVSDTYFPNVPSVKVIEQLNNGYGTKAFDDLQAEYVAYAQTKGYSAKKAEDAFNGMVEQWSTVSGDKPSFGAVRLAEGIGLPKTWVESDLGKLLTRYTKRFAKDRAWHDVVEKDNEVAQLLGMEMDPWGVARAPIPGFKKGALARDQDTSFAINQFIGGRISNPNVDALSRVVNSLLLGPLTGVGNIGSSAANLAKYYKATELPLMAGAWNKLAKSWGKSFETGLNQKNLTTIEDIYDPSSTRFSDKLNDVANAVNKYTGRQKLEEFNRAATLAGSEILVDMRLRQAAAGDAKAEAFLKELANDKDYTKLAPEELATRLSEIVDGTYDTRGLPKWIMDSGVAPYFKLARWNVQQFNNFRKHVWQPALKGNFEPLLVSLGGSALAGILLGELKEKITGKKGNAPAFKEIAEAKDDATKADLLLYKYATAAAYAGFAGQMSDFARALLDYKHGNKPQTMSYPLVDTVEDVVDKSIDAVGAIKQGEDGAEVMMQYWKDILTGHSQALRLLYGAYARANPESQGGRDFEATEKRNELRRFKMVKGLPYEDRTEIPQAANKYLGLKEKEFKRGTDIEKSVGELGGILEDYVKKYGDNYELLKEKLRGLKQNSYQTMPNPDRNFVQFVQYYDYLKKTQGEEEANARLADYMEQNEKNRIKSGFVPSL